MTTRSKYRLMGTCLWCPKPRKIIDEKVYALCIKHMVDLKTNNDKRSDRPKQGLCRRCRNPVKPNRTMCEYHLTYERNRTLIRRMSSINS